jgi:hypothetical protein
LAAKRQVVWKLALIKKSEVKKSEVKKLEVKKLEVKKLEVKKYHNPCTAWRQRFSPYLKGTVNGK